jgi:hypothetical protein
MRPALLAVPLVLAACAPGAKDATGSAPIITYTATDFAFTGPDSITPGVTAIRLVNHGNQMHHLILGRVAEGKTADDVIAAARKNPTAEPPFASWRGAVGVVGPGDSAAGSMGDLPAGHYLLLCFMADPSDGTVHLVKGMTKQLVVAGPRHEAPPPAADAEFHLKDYAFVGPDLTAGTHTIHVVNDGPQTHELQLVRLNGGATSAQFLGSFAPGASGPPPGMFLGGPGAFAVGEGGYWTVTLTPGRYLFICFVPDTITGPPHVTKGMIRELTVS